MFSRCGCLNTQSVDVSFHHALQRSEHQAVASEGLQAFKMLGHNMDAEVSLAIARARMSYMEMTLIDHLQLQRREFLLQLRLDLRKACVAHGKTCLKGFTITLSYTPAAT